MFCVVHVYVDPEFDGPGCGGVLNQLVKSPLVWQLKPNFGRATSRDDVPQNVHHWTSRLCAIDGEVVHAVTGGDALRCEAAHRQKKRKDLLDMVPGVIRFLAALHHDS